MSCITQNETIDLILNSFQRDLGDSFVPYRNHVYRVYNFAIPGLSDQNHHKALAIAAAFHDLGIWTHKTFDYIQPSVDLAMQYCKENLIEAELFQEIELTIKDHHKLSSIKKSALAEVFRKADMTDLSLGLIRNRTDSNLIHEIMKTFPNKGFHVYLFRLFVENLFVNPLKPLPMYKL